MATTGGSVRVITHCHGFNSEQHLHPTLARKIGAAQHECIFKPLASRTLLLANQAPFCLLDHTSELREALFFFC